MVSEKLFLLKIRIGRINMKKQLVRKMGLWTLGFLGVLTVTQIAIGNSSSPPSGKTGAPGENKCIQCHTGTAGTGTTSMVFGNNETQYVPGQVYTITTNVTDATKSRFGFQITALAGGVGPTVGTFALTNTTNTSTQNATISGNVRRYVSHRSANSNQNWSFQWTAPATDIGPITFFLVGLAANNNNSDSGDKVYSTSFTITAVPPAPPLAAFAAVDTSTCVGTQVSFNDLSANSPTTRQWSFPGGNPTSSTATNPTVSYAAPGSYDVTLIVTNALGADTILLTNYIDVFDLPSLTAVPSPASCFGGTDGSINLTAAGAGGFSYQWSNGATVEDPSGLPAGSHTVTVTDLNGCSNTANFTITEPTELTLALTSQATPCSSATGTATAAPTGGTAPYNYLWSTGSTTTTTTGLAAGSYDVTVTDAHGCATIGTVAVSNIGAPTGSTAIVNPTCNGDQDGAINLTLSGGTGPFTYQWSNGASSEDITGLSAGTYTVTVTTASGCLLTQVVIISEPTPLATTVSSTPEMAGNDGSATVTPTGGNGGYAYLWSNGQSTQTATNLAAGAYTVTVTDSLGCNTVATVNVSLVISVAGPMPTDLFTVGPNPFHEYLTLTPNVTLYGKFTVHMVDIEGRIVYGAMLDAKGAAPVRITPGPLPDGVYFLMIQTAKGKMHKKIIHADR
jgi:PKD repeat protein